MSGLRSEADAWRRLEELRWGGAPTACPRCGAAGRQFFLNPVNGASRKTRTGKASERRIWKCGHCRKQYSVLAGTVLEGTRVSLRSWVLLADNMRSPNPPSAWEVRRKFEVTNQTALDMLARVRQVGWL